MYMLKNQEEILNKKISLFEEKDINITVDDLLKFLDNIYFKHCERTEENLEKFLLEDNIEDIINFLMSDALINPSF